MAEINSTATTREEFTEQFPCTARPFAVWYNSDPDANHLKWAVNDESGEATKEFEDMATALKAAAEMGKEWADEARIQAQALAKVSEHYSAKESRAGAMACLDAIRIIERIGGDPNPDNSMEDHWRNIEAEKMAMLQAAGVQSGFMAGFVAVFAEYVGMVERSGVPDPYVWKPQAAMTEEEKAADRTRYEDAAAI